MVRVVAVTNLKGGIGKTTTVVNVGAGLALKGLRVLLVDTDAQGNLALALGVAPRRTLAEVLLDGKAAADCIAPARPNLHLLAADDSLLAALPVIGQRADWSRMLDKALRPLHSKFDVILIDCGGSLTTLNINALVAANEVLVPTTVEHLSIKGLELLFRQIVKVRPNASSIRTIVPTMYDPRRRQSTELMTKLQEKYGSLLVAPIWVNVRLSEASAVGKTIYEFDPSSRGAADYARLVEQLSERWGFAVSPMVPAQQPEVAEPPQVAPLPVEAKPAQIDPVVSGSGVTYQQTCPNCGRLLRRATVAGYRVVYCDHCRYHQQDLAGGGRR